MSRNYNPKDHATALAASLLRRIAFQLRADGKVLDPGKAAREAQQVADRLQPQGRPVPRCRNIAAAATVALVLAGGAAHAEGREHHDRPYRTSQRYTQGVCDGLRAGGKYDPAALLRVTAVHAKGTDYFGCNPAHLGSTNVVDVTVNNRSE